MWGDINSGPWAGAFLHLRVMGHWGKKQCEMLGILLFIPCWGLYALGSPLCSATPKDEGLLPTPSICPGSQKRGHCRPRRRLWN